MNRNTRNAFIRQMLQNETSIEPSPEFSYNALIKSRQDYDAMYSRSIADPEAFWADMATEHLDWFKPWDAVEEYDFDSDEPFVRYFRGGELNASCNCIDRHLNGPRRNKAALIWQGEPTEEVDVYTYQRLHREVCKAANMLRRLGVRKGDRVVLYMPMVPQLAISMLACARIGRYPLRGVQRPERRSLKIASSTRVPRWSSRQLRIPFGQDPETQGNLRKAH